MSDVVTSADEAVLQRRRFLKGGALLAAAAGGAVAASAGSVLPASADPNPSIPTSTYAIPVQRLLDTRTDEGRGAIVASSPDAFDHKNRLRKGAWIDVFILPVEFPEFELAALFVNLTSSGSTKDGSLTICEPGEKPPVTTLSYRKGKTVSNGAVLGVGIVTLPTLPTAKEIVPVAEGLGVRIFAGGVTHVALDIVAASVVYAYDVGLRTTSDRPQVQRLAKAISTARR